MDEKFSQLRCKLKDKHESADERLIKRMQMEKMATSRKIGHDKQYKFNEEAQEKLDSTDTAPAQ